MVNKVKSRRMERGTKQREAASMVGISQSELSEIERGKVVPSVIIALKIARALCCLVEDIFILGD